MLSRISLQALEVNERLNCLVEPYKEAEVRTLAVICAICLGTPKCIRRILHIHVLVSCGAFLLQRIILLCGINLIKWIENLKSNWDGKQKYIAV